MIVTAAHVVMDNINSTDPKPRDSIAVFTSSHRMFQCAVSSYDLGVASPPSPGIALLECTDANGTSLAHLLTNHSLVSSATPAELWQPLVYTGYVASGSADEPEESMRPSDDPGCNSEPPDAAFHMQSTRSSLQPAGPLQSVGRIEAAIESGVSGGPVIGKRCELYGIMQGFFSGAGSLYSTVHAVEELCKRSAHVHGCVPMPMVAANAVADSEVSVGLQS